MRDAQVRTASLATMDYAAIAEAKAKEHQLKLAAASSAVSIVSTLVGLKYPERGKQIAVIGAGTMGNGIAHVVSLGGYDVAALEQETAAFTSTRFGVVWGARLVLVAAAVVTTMAPVPMSATAVRSRAVSTISLTCGSTS